VERKEDIDVFTYTSVLLLVMLVEIVSIARVLQKRKIFPASVCDRVTFCLGVFRFVSPPITRRRYSPFNHSRL